LIIENARYLALTVLSENEKANIPLDRTIDKYTDKFALLSKRDRALANALIYGVLRFRGKLDWIISRFSTRKINTLEPTVVYLLRMGLFQIIFLDKIPISAAVNTSVEMAKKISNKGAAGFVNAVLRKAGTGYSNLSPPDLNKDPALFIAIEKSMPLWLAKRWIKRFGLNKTLQLCDSINEIPFITIRTNSLKISREDLAQKLENEAASVLLTKYEENGISIAKPLIAVNEMEIFKKGYFHVQDEAAQIVTSMLLDPQPGETLLDVCAGLGGKTGHMGQLMENKGRIIAIDIDINKLQHLETGMKRLGISIVSIQKRDILKPAIITSKEESLGNLSLNRRISSFTELYDRVLLDAPCTGLGVLRRNPDSKWARSYRDIKRLSQKQKTMLLKAAKHVKLNGVLVYSVCSCEPEENENVINYFLEKRPDFMINHNIKPIHNDLYKTMISDDGFFRTYPDHYNMDGFFAVSLKRNKDQKETY